MLYLHATHSENYKAQEKDSVLGVPEEEVEEEADNGEYDAQT